MKLLKIIKAPDPRLLKFAQTVSIFDANLRNFAEDMMYTMEKKNGCGLASIQVEDDPIFNLKSYDNYRAQPNLIILKPQNDITIAVNPQILEYGDTTEFAEEGCLSLPGEKNYAMIQRSCSIKVQYQDLNGTVIMKTLHEFEARVFQHEYDHTIGKIFPNRLEKSRENLFWLKFNKEKI